MSWRGLDELRAALGVLEPTFIAFSAAQEAHWRLEGVSMDEIEPMLAWLEHRWGYIRHSSTGSVEITVYEITGQYCGSFRWADGTWTDLESGFSWRAS